MSFEYYNFSVCEGVYDMLLQQTYPISWISYYEKIPLRVATAARFACGKMALERT
jgi:hypothetical protein